MSLIFEIIAFLLSLALCWSLIRPFFFDYSNLVESKEENIEAAPMLELAIRDLEEELALSKITKEEFETLKHELAKEEFMRQKRISDREGA